MISFFFSFKLLYPRKFYSLSPLPSSIHFGRIKADVARVDPTKEVGRALGACSAEGPGRGWGAGDGDGGWVVYREGRRILLLRKKELSVLPREWEREATSLWKIGGGS